MIKNLSWILIILFAVGCNTSKSTTMNKNENKLSKAETDDGWQLLFDGQSSKGWHSYGHPDAKLYTHRTGDLYDLLAAKEAEKPLGEWNQVEIKSFNGQLDFYLNGEHTLSTKIWDQNWNEMVAISKFKDMPGFGKYKSGKIALQDHGDDVWYKNIKIKRL